jgi:hypothetical protein
VPVPGQTAIVVPIPAADPMLREVASVNPQAVREGAAHVSLLYPFFDASSLGDEVWVYLLQFAARTGPVAFELLEVQPTPGFVHIRVPALKPLVAELRTRWPQIVPYGGRFGADPAPHITLAMGLSAEAGAAVAARVRRFLPLVGLAEYIWIVLYNGEWSVLEAFPLRG